MASKITLKILTVKMATAMSAKTEKPSTFNAPFS
jgi:hypothetical protein